MATTSEFVDYFELLTLSSTASSEEIEVRIRDEMRLWVKRTEAPDMAMRQQAERRVKELTEAKRTLLDPTARQHYEAELRSRPAPTTQADAMPAEGEDLVALAQAHLADGDALSAVYVASRATERQPGVSEAWAVLAEGKLAMGRTDDAVYEYRKAIDLQPTEPSYYFGLGGVHERRKEWQQGWQYYNQASQMEPSNALYRVAVANIYIQTSQAQQAVPILEQAASELPASDVVRYYLALAYHDAAVQSSTPLSNGNSLITTPQQASYGNEMVGRAQALGVADPEITNTLDRLAGNVRYALEKHWGYTVGSTLKWGTVLFVLFLIFVAASPALSILVLAGAGLWIYLGFQPGWKINHKQSLTFRAPGPVPLPPAY